MAGIEGAALQRVSEGITKQVELRLNQVLARAHADLMGQPPQKVRQALEQRIRDEVPFYRLSDDELDKWAGQFSGATDRSATATPASAHSRK